MAEIYPQLPARLFLTFLLPDRDCKPDGLRFVGKLTLVRTRDEVRMNDDFTYNPTYTVVGYELPTDTRNGYCDYRDMLLKIKSFPSGRWAPGKSVSTALGLAGLKDIMERGENDYSAPRVNSNDYHRHIFVGVDDAGGQQVAMCELRHIPASYACGDVPAQSKAEVA